MPPHEFRRATRFSPCDFAIESARREYVAGRLCTVFDVRACLFPGPGAKAFPVSIVNSQLIGHARFFRPKPLSLSK
jgi:hypothetical protein